MNAEIEMLVPHLEACGFSELVAKLREPAPWWQHDIAVWNLRRNVHDSFKGALLDQIKEALRPVKPKPATLPDVSGLAPSQAVAREAIINALRDKQRVVSLVGPAGTGKTWLTKTLLNDIQTSLGRNTVLVAPTGKAAARLKEMTGKEASTIHKLLYANVTETNGKPVFSGPRAIAQPGDVVIVDECSMVGSRLYADMLDKLPEKCSVLFVGDREQLPPVQDTWGVDFTNPTGLLTEVLRQAAGSPIIQAATALREGQTWDALPFKNDTALDEVHGATIHTAADWLSERRARDEDATLLTFANTTRREANRQVVQCRIESGMRDDGILAVGDTVVCTLNSRGAGLLNGETRTVQAIMPFGKINSHDRSLVCWTTGENAWVLPEFLYDGIPSDVWQSLTHFGTKAAPVLKAEHGECLTVHKSQGSQWKKVGIVFDKHLRRVQYSDPQTFQRLMYTALTRASEQVVVFNVQDGVL